MSASAPIDPSRTALLVMDYQNGILGMVENSDELLAIARNLTKLFREHGGTVAYVRAAFTDSDLNDLPQSSGIAKLITPERRAGMHADHPATQIHASIAPQDGDIVVRKRRVGAFSTTDLDEQLRARGIDTLVLAGVSTSGCVQSTVLDAYDRDYRVIVLSDACADGDAAVHNFLLEQIFPRRGDVIQVRELHSLLHQGRSSVSGPLATDGAAG